MATVVLLGLVANAMSLVVLTRPKIRETSFNQLLAVMCIVDSLFIFCNIMSCLQAFGIKHGSYNEISKWPLCFNCNQKIDFRPLENNSRSHGCFCSSVDVLVSFDDCGFDLWKAFCNQVTSQSKALFAMLLSGFYHFVLHLVSDTYSNHRMVEAFVLLRRSSDCIVCNF